MWIFNFSQKALFQIYVITEMGMFLSEWRQITHLPFLKVRLTESLNLCGPMHQCGDAQMSVPMRSCKHNFPRGLCFCCRSPFLCFFIRGSQETRGIYPPRSAIDFNQLNPWCMWLLSFLLLMKLLTLLSDENPELHLIQGNTSTSSICRMQFPV